MAPKVKYRDLRKNPALVDQILLEAGVEVYGDGRGLVDEEAAAAAMRAAVAARLGISERELDAPPWTELMEAATDRLAAFASGLVEGQHRGSFPHPN